MVEVSEAMLDAGSRILCRAYQIDDGFSEEQATRHAAGGMGLNFRREAKDCYLAMRALEPSLAGSDVDAIVAFVRESNRIEGIHETTNAHIAAHRAFLDGAVTIPALVALVNVLQPGARFRNKVSTPGVRVGDHIAPPSGPEIESELRSILAMRDPWQQHVAYETLHPFTDGNGRSGRAIWLHRHVHDFATDEWAVKRGFLHSFYYQTLKRCQARRPSPRKQCPMTDSDRAAR